MIENKLRETVSLLHVPSLSSDKDPNLVSRVCVWQGSKVENVCPETPLGGIEHGTFGSVKSNKVGQFTSFVFVAELLDHQVFIPGVILYESAIIMG
jgi:hypothetical protein